MIEPQTPRQETIGDENSANSSQNKRGKVKHVQSRFMNTPASKSRVQPAKQTPSQAFSNRKPLHPSSGRANKTPLQRRPTVQRPTSTRIPQAGASSTLKIVQKDSLEVTVQVAANLAQERKTFLSSHTDAQSMALDLALTPEYNHLMQRMFIHARQTHASQLEEQKAQQVLLTMHHELLKEREELANLEIEAMRVERLAQVDAIVRAEDSLFSGEVLTQLLANISDMIGFLRDSSHRMQVSEIHCDETQLLQSLEGIEKTLSPLASTLSDLSTPICQLSQTQARIVRTLQEMAQKGHETTELLHALAELQTMEASLMIQREMEPELFHPMPSGLTPLRK